MKKTLLITCIIAVVLGTAVYLYRTQTPPVPPADVAGYVVGHITELSPVAASLGGTFYVTSISSSNGKGVVEYEDGHSAYTADFTYSSTRSGSMKITSFSVRE